MPTMGYHDNSIYKGTDKGYDNVWCVIKEVML